jgi:hypothetical protein
MITECVENLVHIELMVVTELTVNHCRDGKKVLVTLVAGHLSWLSACFPTVCVFVDFLYIVK